MDKMFNDILSRIDRLERNDKPEIEIGRRINKIRKNVEDIEVKNKLRHLLIFWRRDILNKLPNRKKICGTGTNILNGPQKGTGRIRHQKNPGHFKFTEMDYVKPTLSSDFYNPDNFNKKDGNDGLTPKMNTFVEDSTNAVNIFRDLKVLPYTFNYTYDEDQNLTDFFEKAQSYFDDNS
ncbi:hypothetical protein GJ496_009501 [Pomphorhynchus laevis]|nr:hypothetical protein GJ496_009501 [Pomphorhynchus laevis]